jgi:hypothetical protein
MLDYLIPKKTGFEPNQYRNFGFEKSSGIPVFGIPVLKALVSSNTKNFFCPVHTHQLLSIILCLTLVNVYLLVILYGELLLKKAAICGVKKDKILV